MKFLVTGNAGFIGFPTASTLLERATRSRASTLSMAESFANLGELADALTAVLTPPCGLESRFVDWYRKYQGSRSLIRFSGCPRLVTLMNNDLKKCLII